MVTKKDSSASIDELRLQINERPYGTAEERYTPLKKRLACGETQKKLSSLLYLNLKYCGLCQAYEFLII
jgi:hypothetical protein